MLSLIDFLRFLFKIVYTTVKVLYQVNETSRNFLCTVISIVGRVKNKGGTTQESRVYKIEIWIRARAHGRGYSCNRIRCSPLPTPRSLDPPDSSDGGMEVLIEKLAIYERTSRLH